MSRVVRQRFDLLVVGGGPAGIAAAVYAAEFGSRVGIVVEMAQQRSLRVLQSRKRVLEELKAGGAGGPNPKTGGPKLPGVGGGGGS